MAHEAVEVEGRRGAGVDLEVAHLGHGVELAPHQPGGLQRHLERRPLGVVDEHLQLALVVEGEHLHPHDAERHERGGAEEDREHPGEEAPARERPG